jgi:hypothetical protein
MSENDYWKNILRYKSKDFKDGLIEGIRAHAIWKDGKQVVGCLEKSLLEEIKTIDIIFLQLNGE